MDTWLNLKCMHVREHALRGHVCVGGLRRLRMSKAGGVSNVEVSTNLEKTCRMMSYHAVVRISYLVGRGSFRRKWMGGATAVKLDETFFKVQFEYTSAK